MNKMCCICGGIFSEYGCNPAPFWPCNGNEQCCYDCDNRYVSPARIIGVQNEDILKLMRHMAILGRMISSAKELQQ